MIGFGLDSILELAAGAILIWRLQTKWGNDVGEYDAERRAHKLVGITFFVLAVYILIQSIATLFGIFPEPEQTSVGLILIIASAIVMTILYYQKMVVAEKIGSRALRAEAKETLVCDLRDLTVLVGLGANFLFGWWWADPVAALGLIPFLIKEGWGKALRERIKMSKRKCPRFRKFQGGQSVERASRLAVLSRLFFFCFLFEAESDFISVDLLVSSR